MNKYTKEHHEFIVAHVKGLSNKELAKLFNKEFDKKVTADQMNSYKGRYKLRSGLNTTFKAGAIPINKGKKWDDYMSKEKQKQARKTTFKKGNKPKQYQPIGTEIQKSDGYVYIKLEDVPGCSRKGWKSKHHIVWEKEHGKIPEKHRLIFLDGDRTNCTIDNLMLCSYGQSAIMNSKRLFTGNPEATKAGALIAAITIKVNERTKEQ